MNKILQLKCPLIIFITTITLILFYIFPINNINKSSDSIYGNRISITLKDEFNIKLNEKTKLIIINSNGCINCTNSLFNHIQNDKSYDNYHFILTKRFVYQHKHYTSNEFFNRKKIIIDYKNIFENLNVPIYGVTIIRMDRKNNVFFTPYVK